MLTFIRKNQKTLVLVVSIFVIIAFIWLYNSVNFERLGESTVGRMYGRVLTTTDFQQETRMFNLAIDMGPLPVVQALTTGAVTMNDATDRYIIAVLVLRHEAAQLGVVPSREEVRAALTSLPVFQTGGQFDPVKFTQFSQNFLLPRGFTEQQLEEVMRDNIRYERLRRLAGSPGAATPALLAEAFGFRNGKVEPSVIRFDLAPLLAAAEASDEEIQAFYEANIDHLQTEETRRVQHAMFGPSEEEKALEGRERVAALQQWADAAGKFAAGVLSPEAEFAALAAEAGATVGETALFPVTEPPVPFNETPLFGRTAFSLTESDPTSDAFPVGETFVVLKLLETQPARPLTLEEARPRIVEAITREKAANQLAEQAAAARQKLTESLANGMDWEGAVAAAELTATNVPAFSRMEPFLDAPDSSAIMTTALPLEAGAISEFVPTEAGGLLVFVKARHPIDPAALDADRPFLVQTLTDANESALFREWLRLARQASGFTRNNLR